jgi:hypothetical protein
MLTVLTRDDQQRDGGDRYVMLILLVAAFSNLPLIYGQFSGDDEPLLAWTCTKIANQFHDWKGIRSLINVGLIFSYDTQPPLRYLLALPGMIAFPGREFGFRAVSVLFSLLMTWQVIKLGKELGGLKVACVSGVVVAVSAIYNWTSMAFGWSVAVTMLILAMRTLRVASLNLADAVEIRNLLRVNLCLIVAFLINTGNILFFAMTALLYGWANRNRWRALIKPFAPIVYFYVLYYAYFIGFVSRYSVSVAGANKPQGQISQNAGRWAQAHLNVTSLLENLQTLNGHYVPYLAWVFFACAAAYLIKKELRVAIWLVPFVLAWSFFLIGNTGQYFILASVCGVPFAVAWLNEHLPHRAFTTVLIVLIATMASWNGIMFVKPYRQTDYPERILEWGYARRGYHHNVVLPWRRISADATRRLGEDGRFVDNVDGAFSLFYCKDDPRDFAHSRRAGRLGDISFPTSYDVQRRCLRIMFDPAITRVRTVVTEQDLCASDNVEKTSYPGSRVKVYVLRSHPAVQD